jgi:hypothetical protein
MVLDSSACLEFLVLESTIDDGAFVALAEASAQPL